ncbi:D-ribose transporter ATP-binding protein [Gordoniibacillus kamchatkensis]|uniref:D-ribose transporter ATP-binding protein n=2 Tax=Gordoniibacillus kamchatkensis TaxID=1590651 RepID=A0ABR5AH58_9BACL|nr:sugar ABC transporter ATP-binding protein [Paenibacillus sp. VKM B-2647]KIL40393.1 D-ribose transporter ATP-binding protein [Paenibacillus sp. VKM B-2647]
MRHISKAFHGVHALKGVHFEVRRGEVHALMGENGAGKSTLMRILTGLVQPDEGDIVFYGRPLPIDSPQTALRHGIAMIHQELNPIPEMTIAENIFLGREPEYGKTGFVNKPLLFRQTAELLDEFRLKLDPRTKVKQLSVAQKQMLEIVKAVSYNARLLIMDEPTSALSEEEVQTLFHTIEKLKQRGVPIVYISHRLEEIFKIADRVTVLRDGEYISTTRIEALSKDELITMMVGRPLSNIFPKEAAKIGKPILEVENLSRSNVFSDIQFNVRSGEILGIAGLMGAGRSEVMRAIFGIDRFDAGEIRVDGIPAHIRKPADAIRLGIALVTEDRKELGLVLCRSVKENMTLASLNALSNGLFINRLSEIAACSKMTGDITVKMSGLDQTVQSLSGGNQQKVVLAKWLMRKPKVLILDEPTRGIDVGAKAEIYRLMSDLARDGMAIIMISSELPEIMGMSDRILVMGEGRIKGEFMRGQVTQEEILECAIGGAGIV